MSDQTLTPYSNHFTGAEIAAQRIVIALLESGRLNIPAVDFSPEDAKKLGEFLAVTTTTLAKKLQAPTT